MAEGGFDPCANQKAKVQQVCRYFVHGACYKGDNCQFVHDRTGTAPANNICKFYQQGKCNYGSRCRYDHVRPQPTDIRNTSPQRRKKGPQRHLSPETSTRKDVSRKRNDDGDGRLRRNDSSSNDNWESSFVTLKKSGSSNSSKHDISPGKGASGGMDNRRSGDNQKPRVVKKNWAKAKDFVPGQRCHAGASYANRARNPDQEKDGRDKNAASTKLKREPREEDLMCPYFAHGHCPFDDRCSYVHGDVCDYCQMPRLHPTDEIQREEHKKECLRAMEEDVEHSFAVQLSEKKECCICLEIVLEKTSGFARQSNQSNQFGILENCTHCFCLDCIRRWRSDKTSFGKNVRVCPICRVHSDFVTPSSLWVEEEAAKKKVIQDYKDALRLKPCQYFKQGKGECPFNEKCFYKHAYPDGTIASPKPRRKPRRQVNADGELGVMESISLWDFLERREDGLISLEDELSLYLLGMMGDSDDEDDYWLYHGGDDSSDDDFSLYPW